MSEFDIFWGIQSSYNFLALSPQYYIQASIESSEQSRKGFVISCDSCCWELYILLYCIVCIYVIAGLEYRGFTGFTMNGMADRFPVHHTFVTNRTVFACPGIWALLALRTHQQILQATGILAEAVDAELRIHSCWFQSIVDCIFNLWRSFTEEADRDIFLERVEWCKGVLHGQRLSFDWVFVFSNPDEWMLPDIARSNMVKLSTRIGVHQWWMIPRIMTFMGNPHIFNLVQGGRWWVVDGNTIMFPSIHRYTSWMS